MLSSASAVKCRTFDFHFTNNSSILKKKDLYLNFRNSNLHEEEEEMVELCGLGLDHSQVSGNFYQP